VRSTRPSAREAAGSCSGDDIGVSEMTAKTGYFVFSLDTELAYGYYDSDQLRQTRFSPDGTRERKSIARLLDILDEFGIAATWACVGHMFYERCENCAVCPVLSWKGKYSSFDAVYETNHPLWYGADVIDMLLARGAHHEIAFHGYTHEVFDERTMSEEEARTEIREWLRVAKRKNIVPRTVVFPRNRVGHLRLFAEFGFLCYRGAEPASNAGMFPYLGKIRRRLRQVPFVLTPPVYVLPNAGPLGLVNMPASPNYFRRGRRFNRFFDALNLGKLSMSGAIRGVGRAAKEGKIVHIWSHPCDFQTDKDWEKLRHLFSHVSEQVSQGTIQSVTMGDLARKTRLVGTR
jgi:peptidoglycan/xylan/chitin deacetylase (PgdA/CDA1 family)